MRNLKKKLCYDYTKLNDFINNGMMILLDENNLENLNKIFEINNYKKWLKYWNFRYEKWKILYKNKLYLKYYDLDELLDINNQLKKKIKKWQCKNLYVLELYFIIFMYYEKSVFLQINRFIKNIEEIYGYNEINDFNNMFENLQWILYYNSNYSINNDIKDKSYK